MYRPLTRDMSGVNNPRKAFRGLRPKVLKSRLNQTTSGLCLAMALRMRNELVGSSNDQQRWTSKPSSSS